MIELNGYPTCTCNICFVCVVLSTTCMAISLTLFTFRIFQKALSITENVAFFAPRNADIEQLVSCSGQGNKVEIEQNFINKKLKTLTAYYGELVNP